MCSVLMDMDLFHPQHFQQAVMDDESCTKLALICAFAYRDEVNPCEFFSFNSVEL